MKALAQERAVLSNIGHGLHEVAKAIREHGRPIPPCVSAGGGHRWNAPLPFGGLQECRSCGLVCRTHEAPR